VVRCRSSPSHDDTRFAAGASSAGASDTSGSTHDFLNSTSPGMPPGKSRQSILRSEAVTTGWLAGREQRKQLEAVQLADYALTRTLLLRGHVERWMGKLRLPADPVILRALARGGGWVRLEALCTQPKMRLLKATPEEVAAALRGSRVVELRPQSPTQALRPTRPGAASSSSETESEKDDWHVRHNRLLLYTYI